MLVYNELSHYGLWGGSPNLTPAKWGGIAKSQALSLGGIAKSTG